MYVLTFLRDGLGVLGLNFVVDPLLYLYEARAVVDFVGVVCGLGGDGVHLADERKLGVRVLVLI